MAEPCPPSADSVSVIDRCPMNSSEWNQRAMQKNCSMYPQTCIKPLQYHCLLNTFGNESIEVCAPNTWLDSGKYHHGRIIEGPLTLFRAKLCCWFRSALTGRHRRKLPAEKAWRYVEVNNFGFLCFLIIIHLVRNL